MTGSGGIDTTIIGTTIGIITLPIKENTCLQDQGTTMFHRRITLRSLQLDIMTMIGQRRDMNIIEEIGSHAHHNALFVVCIQH